MGNTAQACSNTCMQRCQLGLLQGQLSPIKNMRKNGAQVDSFEAESQNLVIQNLNQRSDLEENIQSTGQYKDHSVKQIINKSSLRKCINISEQTLATITKAALTSFLDVPYSVIRLTTTQKLNRVIYEFGKSIFQKYENDKNGFNKWKLHKKGFYINYLGDCLLAIFATNMYYQGQLLEKQNEFLPSKEGILMTQNGMYIGQFVDGKANGKGMFKGIQPLTIYKGTWKQGVLVKGVIDNEQYKFQGQIKNCLAHGKGKMYFKKTNYKYHGNFSKGLFHDENGVLQCNNYVYEGSFQKGFKQGQGCLTQKQNLTKNKIKLYNPSQYMDGMWHQDTFSGVKMYVNSAKAITQLLDKQWDRRY